jgi:DNA-binding transcriptional MerR regulator
MTQLTDAQKQEIQQMVQSMKDSGATQQEIRDAVNAKLQGWGIQVPQDNGGQPRQPPWMSQLTDQQKQEIKQLMDSLTQSGATPQEIRDAVNAKLQEWGIEVPAPPQSSGQ